MFDRYIALGDSISIDRYPALDLMEQGRDHPRSGAVSLVYQNDDSLWPEFRARDLRTAHPDLAFDRSIDDLTADGAVLSDVDRIQLPRVSASDERTLITLTIGGNDLLSSIGRQNAPPALGDLLLDRLTALLGRIADARPRSLVLLATVYDPSDGSETLYGQHLPDEAAWLEQYNAGIRNLAGRLDDVRLVDIHRHFMGHGMKAPADERWYWNRSIIEPSARGASEVRRLWLEALGL